MLKQKNRQQITVQANITILFWQVGNRINHDILQNKLADYARQIDLRDYVRTNIADSQIIIQILF